MCRFEGTHFEAAAPGLDAVGAIDYGHIIVPPEMRDRGASTSDLQLLSLQNISTQEALLLPEVNRDTSTSDLHTLNQRDAAMQTEPQQPMVNQGVGNTPQNMSLQTDTLQLPIHRCYSKLDVLPY
jgi:hypothetical protein